MIRFINILYYILIALCALNMATAVLIHFSSADVTTPFPIRAFSAIIVGVAAYMLLVNKNKRIALFGLVSYLLLVGYYTYSPLPGFGITFTGALESLIYNATSSFLLSSFLSYLGTILVLVVILCSFFSKKTVSTTLS